MQTFKNALKKWKNDGGSVHTKVERFLFAYRNTPHATTGISPAEMLLKRRPRTGLSLITPSLSQRKGASAKTSMKDQRVRSFGVGDRVMARSFRAGDKWIPGVVVKVTGPLSYHIKIASGVLRRHVDQLTPGARSEGRIEVEEPVADEGEMRQTEEVIAEQNAPQEAVLPPSDERSGSPFPTAEAVVQPAPSNAEEVPADTTQCSGEAATPVEPRRSTRSKKKPGWMDGYVC